MNNFPSENEVWTAYILDSERAFIELVEAMSRAKRPKLCYMSRDRKHLVLVTNGQRAGKR